MRPRRALLLIAMVGATGLAATGLGTVETGDSPFLFGMLIVLGLCAAAMAWVLYRNLRMHIDRIERQLDAVQSAVALTRAPVTRPLFLSRHAAAADFVELIVEVIRRTNATRVLELGSGTSSSYIASVLPGSSSGGMLVCLEDNYAWATLVQRELELPAVLTLQSRVIHAPLAAVESGSLPFYECDSRSLLADGPFDMIVVDGPGDVNLRGAIFDELETLGRPSVTVLLDDGDQPAIRQAVRNWLSENPSWSSRYYSTVKGSWILWNAACTWDLPLP